jgi:signal transduction histidine kinase
MKSGLFLLSLFCALSFGTHAQDETSLLKLLNDSKDDTSRFYVLRDLGYLHEFDDSAKALQYYRQEKTIAETLSSALFKSMAFLDIGSVHFNSADFETALIFYKESLKWARLSTECKRTGVALQNIANSYYSIYLLDSAVVYGVQALRAQNDCFDTSNTILMCANMAAYYDDLHQFKESLNYAKQGITLCEASQNFQGYVAACLAAATVAIKIGDRTLFDSYLQKGKSKMNLVVQPFYKSSLYQNLSGLYYDVNEFSEANLYADSAIHYLMGNEENNMSASVFMSKGLALRKVGKPEDAISMLEKALLHALQKRDWFVARESHLGLSEINEELGNVKKAYEHHLSYVQYKDSTQRIDSERLVAEMTAKYRNEKQQVELARLHTQAEKDQLEKAQNRKIFILVLTSALLAIATITALYLLQRRRNTLLRQKEAIATEQLKRLESEKQIVVLDSMLKGEESERSRVAKDLHDGVGSLLSGVKLSLSSMGGNMFISESHAKIFERSLHQLDDAIIEMRRVAQNMMPEILVKGGLIQAIAQLASGISQSGNISIHFEHHHFDRRLPGDTEVIVYRLVQELLQNIVKHSFAKEVIIQISEHENNIHLVVEDNGKGFNTETWEKSTGMGFSNLRNRVNYLKGTIHVKSTPDDGSSFLIEFKREP